MNISDWLDEQAAQQGDVSQIQVPSDLLYDNDPDETLYFEEVNPCGMLCRQNHPFSTVERYGHWYHSRGQDRQAGIHSQEMKWHLWTRDKAAALRTAEEHIGQEAED